MSRKIAKEYKEAGLNPVPLKQGGKIPIRNDWVSPINDDIDKYEFEEIGICTGAVSGGLEGMNAKKFLLRLEERVDILNVTHHKVMKLSMETLLR